MVGGRVPRSQMWLCHGEQRLSAGRISVRCELPGELAYDIAPGALTMTSGGLVALSQASAGSADLGSTSTGRPLCRTHAGAAPAMVRFVGPTLLAASRPATAYQAVEVVAASVALRPSR